ncbi:MULTISPECIES: hypothetical protein [Metabacillus]|uniref:hypothetical protein n=1 Tax=Metabacillus TaxID=2675233 RepID=UPI000EF58C5C|nr:MULTISPECIES: hypothetical protein [Metabacillus]UGB30574.1 hypothetical protein LPC09_23235 [Metabacillus sp. B2-18]UHA61429.1 hypothetical protein KDJ21_007165 [Metabacillus litoralis]
MNIFLLHWAGFIFLVGLLLSLPLGAVYYLHHSELKQFFTNPRKLKSAHLDFIMQAFSIGLVFLLELGTNHQLPVFAVIPLAFGTFCNPFIFLLEATPLYNRGFVKILYQILKGLSPSALFFAWFVLAFTFLPTYILWLLLGFILLLAIASLTYNKQHKKIVSNTKKINSGGK